MKKKLIPLQEFIAEGNKGGSFIHLQELPREPGMIILEVGETCVITVHEKVSVVGLAMVLSYAKEQGFQKLIDEYLKFLRGSPTVSIDRDGVVNETN